MARRPTIIDVAKEAGVSKSTVSLVLQNSPLVKAETRADVRRAMADLGYVYNRSAANLRMSNAGLIGLVINDLRNPFFTEFATSVQMALSARGYATVLANTDENPALQAQVTSAMIEHGVSALILSPAYGDEEATFGAIARAGIPAMQVLRQVVPAERFPFAAPDYESGGRLAAQHLLARGARQIAFVGGLDGRAVTRLRMSGYLAVLAGAGLTPTVLPGRPGRAFGREVARRLALDYPQIDAVICFNDLVALGLLSGCAEIGRRVGSDLMVVGFDDIEDCALVWPGLTTVSCDIARFGQTCAATVLAWLEDGTAPPTDTHSPVTLIRRASTGD
ncbi:LacI family DNA-binding transcriptional regulator [Fertoebacter nigrum]|uniref:LacI family DNA-binding transcriptional regulator n=1 Tax=Fertoeibacter niger TaxID=2656921 RepID=A0A8X8KNV7_9RHOB|nr:LacI family DNA-binding transcriptional regulator [Fertoeibacter niger]NUB44211.1 LacI family DNA-binding transcriptional regulator [Fertoeibacter niger]